MTALKPGAPMLKFELLDIHGELHRAEDGLGRWQLLVFHRHLG